MSLAAFKATSAAPPKTILILLHQATSLPGRVGQRLRELGFALDVRYPAQGQELPLTLAEHAGVVVFGGPMSANDNELWIRREIDWLKTPLRDKKPFLGLCLGAQLMARQLGARVYTAASQAGELGYHPLHATPAADRLCPIAFPKHVYQWHFEGFDLPAGAYRLAEGAQDFPNQAFIFERNVVGLQFHPEVTYQMICRWTTRGGCRLPAGAQQRHREEWFRYDNAVDRWLSAFLRAWATDALLWSDPIPSSYAIAAE